MFTDSVKVVVVDDDAGTLDLVVSYLQSAGIKAEGLPTPIGALSFIENQRPDVVILDKVMPGMTGNELVTQIRSHQSVCSTPILMITGLDTEDGQIASFNLGIDDYLTKPFSLRQLLARVHALSRRSKPAASRSNVLTSGALKLDLTAHRVTLRDQPVELTFTEFKLLNELLSHRGEVLSRDHLRQFVLSHQHVTDRTVDVHVSSLRKKLMETGQQIETVRSVGYRFTG